MVQRLYITSVLSLSLSLPLSLASSHSASGVRTKFLLCFDATHTKYPRSCRHQMGSELWSLISSVLALTFAFAFIRQRTSGFLTNAPIWKLIIIKRNLFTLIEVSRYIVAETTCAAAVKVGKGPFTYGLRTHRFGKIFFSHTSSFWKIIHSDVSFDWIFL